MLFLPVVPYEPDYRFSTTIAREPYIIDVHWNDRDEAWYFHLFEIDEKPIAHGVKIVLGTPLARALRHRLISRGAGAFFAYDTSKRDIDAGFGDLGQRVRLIYLTGDELAALVLELTRP